jgi:hypothetical protein
MRTIAITATFVLTAWWNHSTSVDAGANVRKSIDSTALNASDMLTYVGP